MNPIDRRGAERHDTWLPFVIEGRESYKNDFIENLSLSGAFVRTVEPAALRTRLKISIVAPKTSRSFNFDAEVMRVIEPESATAEGVAPGMGISFIDIGGGDHRPAVVEILGELHALTEERARAQVEVEPTDPGKPAPPPPAPVANDQALREAFARLETFLHQARSQNYYEILGVDAAGATAATIKKNYHRRSKEFHPDRFHRANSSEIQARVEELYGLLTKAYETLRDPVKREQYDRTHGVRATVEFRRAAAKARFDQAVASIAKGRLFGATVGLKVALVLDPANPEIQRKLEEVERKRKFFIT